MVGEKRRPAPGRVAAHVALRDGVAEHEQLLALGHGREVGAVVGEPAHRARREARQPDAHVVGLPHARQAHEAALGGGARVLEVDLHEVVLVGQAGGQRAAVNHGRHAVVGRARDAGVALHVLDDGAGAARGLPHAQLQAHARGVGLELQAHARGAGGELAVVAGVPGAHAPEGAQLLRREADGADPAVLLCDGVERSVQEVCRAGAGGEAHALCLPCCGCGSFRAATIVAHVCARLRAVPKRAEARHSPSRTGS